MRATEIIRARTVDAGAVAWEEKASATDFVSDVDRAAEAAARAVIFERHPNATVTGEELSPEQVTREGLAFVVDPLDGTTNFLHGYPVYAVSVAALRDGVTRAGAVLDVPSGELFTAVAGGGARRGGQPMRVSSINEPSRALVGTGLPFKHPDLIERYVARFADVMRATAGIRRAGSAALDLAAVACGRLDAFWELRLAPWDVAAGILLIREAGGVVTDLDGNPAPVAHGPIVAGNPTMHAWLLKTLTK